MIFNKEGKSGSKELHLLTGSFDAGNNFDAVSSDIALETESVVAVIGRAVYERAENAYLNGDDNTTTEDNNLVTFVQRAVALFAVLRYHRGNLVGKSSGGRKVGIDSSNEKMAWEWMIDRDDEAMQRKAFLALDTLLRWMEETQIVEWLSSPRRAELRALMVPSLDAFERYYYIDGSHRFFFILSPLLREVQDRDIRPLLKDQYDALLAAAHQADHEQSAMLRKCQGAIVLRAMAVAITRFSVKLLPEGVVQQFQSSGQTKRASVAASSALIDKVSADLEQRAQQYIDDVKKEIGQLDNESTDYPLLPENNATNKYFRT